MKAAINLHERMQALRSLIEKASNLQDVIEFLSVDLSNVTSPIQTNEGIAFIWFNLIESQVITLNKIVRKNDSISLDKIINCGEAKEKGFRDHNFKARLDLILQDFKQFHLDDIRDKFVAHTEITDIELSTNLHRLMIVKNASARLFNDIAESVGASKYNHMPRIVDSLRETLQLITSEK